MARLIAFLSLMMLVGCGGAEPDNTVYDKPEDANAGTWQEGKQLFHARCGSCHMVNKEMTGPALRGAEARWPDKQKLYAFIRNSQEVIKTDKYARDLWLKYNQTVMVPHPDLTDAQIGQILGYINSVSVQP